MSKHQLSAIIFAVKFLVYHSVDFISWYVVFVNYLAQFMQLDPTVGCSSLKPTLNRHLRRLAVLNKHMFKYISHTRRFMTHLDLSRTYDSASVGIIT